jgi:hypothetical protein
MAAIPNNKYELVRSLYFDKRLNMSQIGEKLGVSIDAVTFFMRKHQIKRRSLKDAGAVSFAAKKPSFTKIKPTSTRLRDLAAIGAMLYWGEGYKGSVEKPAQTVDFANSDPNMVRMFLVFLRSLYRIDESRLRVLLYCYDNQDVPELISFWSNLTRIPKQQFVKPYVKKNDVKTRDKMKHGLIHVRYADKKLLLDIKDMIEWYSRKYCVDTQVVNGDAL